MVFEELLTALGRESIFETGFLLAGTADPNYVRRQLAEWVSTGKLWQLRRGLYAVAPPYQKSSPHPFTVANRMIPGSYVSLQTALAYYDLIPEHAAVVTSVSARRPAEWQNPIGRFAYRHLKQDLIFGYRQLKVGDDQAAFVATPEKALLDQIYLSPSGDARAYLESMRLQNLDTLNLDKLAGFAARVGKPKLHRAVTIIADLAAEESEYESV